MQYTVGTTAAESLNAAACIFLGQTEAAILIEPALATMTDSEIHAVMTAGFACIAGSLFSAYISFGACPEYLLSATVMSAAVSLAVSKIIYPEIQVSKQKSMKSFKFASRGQNNVLECISDGAVHSAQFVGAIAANLIVYIALLACLNSVLSYFGSLVNHPEFSFNQLLAYIFFPLAYMMGASDASDPAVAMDETMKVAELMGMKTALNEFIAYQKLSEWKADNVLKGARAQTIATYALCGFSNISMIGSQIGILSAMCPQRKSSFAKVAVRALLAGMFSCFMTACVAGMLIDEPLTCSSSASHGCISLKSINFTATTPVS
uniref:Nucleos_tra2_C domain-containing protein n=1 Tax=Steinernema glaseri TaxID=37863 RepID=A0A1I7Z2E8_9BILA